LIRIIFFTIFFLFCEILIINKFLEDLALKYKLWYLNIGDDSQRRVFKIIYDIKHLKDTNIFVFGGSASREFFVNDKNISKSLNVNFYNCAVSSETPFDSYKLQTLLKSSNIIIYAIHPKSLYDTDYNISQITKGCYFGGSYYKYPVFLKQNELKNFNITDNNINFINKLSPELNTYTYLGKIYLKNIIKKIVKNKDLKLFNFKEPQRYYYINKPLNVDLLDKKLNNYFNKLKHTEEILSLNIAVIEQMIKLANKKHNKFVLFELPFSPIIQQRFKPYLKEYYKELNKLLKKYPNVIFISNKTLPISKQNLFYDTIHLLPNGRKYYYKATLKNLKKVINGK